MTNQRIVALCTSVTGSVRALNHLQRGEYLCKISFHSIWCSLFDWHFESYAHLLYGANRELAACSYPCLDKMPVILVRVKVFPYCQQVSDTIMYKAYEGWPSFFACLSVFSLSPRNLSSNNERLKFFYFTFTW